MKTIRNLYWGKISAVFFTLLLLSVFLSAGQPAMAGAPIDSKVIEQVKDGGKSTFWVIMRDQADLSAAYQMKDWNAWGLFVVNRLQAVANQTQPGLHSLLKRRSAEFKPFWIVNAIRVTGDQATLEEVAAQPL